MKKTIIDMHCDTILRCLQGKSLRDMEGTHINLQKMKEGGVAVQCFALFIMTNGDGADYGFEQKRFFPAYEAGSRWLCSRWRMQRLLRGNLSGLQNSMKKASA